MGVCIYGNCFINIEELDINCFKNLHLSVHTFESYFMTFKSNVK